MTSRCCARALLVALAASACSDRPQTAIVAPALAPTSPASSMVDAAPPVPPVTAASTWITTPPAKAELYVALDGMCPVIELRSVDNADFVLTGHHYFYDTRHTLARVTPTGLAVSLTSEDLPIDDIGGHYPDALFLVEGTSSRGELANGVRQLELTAGGEERWVERAPDANAADDLVSYRLPVAWRGGAIYEEYVQKANAAEGESYERLEVKGVTGDLPRPLSFGAPGTDLGFRAFPSGELFVVQVSGGKKAIEARVTSLVSGRAIDVQTIALAKGARSPAAMPRFVGSTLATLRLELGAKRYRFDGAGWNLETKAEHDAVDAAEEALDEATTARDKERGSPGDRWRTNGYSIEHDTGSGFHAVTLPPPPFASDPKGKVTIERAVFGVDDELFVVGTYDEKGRGWAKALPYGVLYRTRRPKETLRCNEPNPEDLEADVGVGFQSWPPIANATCREPFAVLTRKSNTRSNDGEASRPSYQALSRALASNGELRRLPLLQFQSGGRTFAGMKVKDLAQGRALIDLVSRSIPIRGEIVCGAPSASRAIDLNLPPSDGSASDGAP